MHTKTIIMVLAGLGLSTALMASGPQNGEEGWQRGHGGPGMFAQGEQGRAMHRRGGRMGHAMQRGQRRSFLRKIGRQLDLTSDQRKKIRDLFRKERQTKRAARKAHRGAGRPQAGLFGHMNPEQFMSADRFDKAAFTQAFKDQAAKRKAAHQTQRDERLKHRADFLAKVFDVLTPEQRLKWIELTQKYRAKVSK